VREKIQVLESEIGVGAGDVVHAVLVNLGGNLRLLVHVKLHLTRGDKDVIATVCVRAGTLENLAGLLLALCAPSKSHVVDKGQCETIGCFADRRSLLFGLLSFFCLHERIEF